MIKIGLIAAGGVLVAAATAWWMHTSAVNQLQDRLELVSSENAVLRSNIENLNQSIKSTNAAINEANQLYSKYQSQFQQLNQQITLNNKAIKDVLTSIKNDPTPMTCEQAMDYLRKNK